MEIKTEKELKVSKVKLKVKRLTPGPVSSRSVQIQMIVVQLTNIAFWDMVFAFELVNAADS